MKYLALREKLNFNLFSIIDVAKNFPKQSSQLIRTQLSRFVKKGLLTKIKREWYCFNPQQIDELVLANILYQPSYISLESALNYYGLIPDVAQSITSITLTTTKKITNNFGSFYYTKITKPLFYGFSKIKSSQSERFFNMAFKEKALLDYFYIRKIKKTVDLRIDFSLIDLGIYKKMALNFPLWVQKINLNE